jgi:zinc transporter ZupT
VISSFSLIFTTFFILCILGAAAGVWVTGLPEVARRIVPLSGVVLVLICFVWLLPELAAIFGWPLASLITLGSFALIWLFDRYVSPVCPVCAHSHDHDSCATRLHGFATPLVVAAVIHSVFDGWTLVAGNSTAVAYGVLLHKLPETLAFGVILRAALGSRVQAFVWAVIAQAATIVGAALAVVAAPLFGPQWMGILLGLCGGTFLFLGCHAVHGEWKRRTAAKELRLGSQLSK